LIDLKAAPLHCDRGIELQAAKDRLRGSGRLAARCPDRSTCACAKTLALGCIQDAFDAPSHALGRFRLHRGAPLSRVLAALPFHLVRVDARRCIGLELARAGLRGRQLGLGDRLRSKGINRLPDLGLMGPGVVVSRLKRDGWIGPQADLAPAANR